MSEQEKKGQRIYDSFSAETMTKKSEIIGVFYGSIKPRPQPPWLRSMGLF